MVLRQHAAGSDSLPKGLDVTEKVANLVPTGEGQGPDTSPRAVDHHAQLLVISARSSHVDIDVLGRYVSKHE
jgi:hypothetical protein